jgi:DNA repair protein RecO (recombination protein O)
MSAGAAPPVARSTARRAAHQAQAAFVLHRYDWSESSLILDLFTRDAGRIAAAAKGAKRPYSQMRSVLMPFQRIMVQFGRARADESAEVHTLRAAEWAGQGVALNGAAWFAGFYLNELLMRLLARDDPHPRVFDAYALTLRALGREAAGRFEAGLRAFELLLLRETGVLPQLDRVTLTQAAVAPGRWYALNPEQGLVESAASESALTGASCLALQAAMDDLNLEPTAEQLERLHAASADALAELKLQLRQQLHYHLGGATLRTRQVMIDSFRLLGLDASASSR